MTRTPEEQSALDHVWVHAMQYADLEQEDGLKVFVRGEGSTLYDVRGRAFLDGMAGLCIVNVGHGRAEIAEAMAAQACQLAYISSFNHVALPTVQLAEKLATLTPPGGLDTRLRRWTTPYGTLTQTWEYSPDALTDFENEYLAAVWPDGRCGERPQFRGPIKP